MQALGNRRTQSISITIEFGKQCVFLVYYNLCSSRRGLYKHIGNQIRNGHVYLMPYCRNSGYLGIVYGPGYYLLVELPKVFCTSPSPAYYNYIHPFKLIKVVHSLSYLSSGMFPLNPYWTDNNIYAGGTFFEYL